MCVCVYVYIYILHTPVGAMRNSADQCQSSTAWSPRPTEGALAHGAHDSTSN